MYAIVEIAGQQFKVQKDQKIFVHRLAEKEGSSVTFDKVLLTDDGKKVNIGTPTINGASVSAKVLAHMRGDKVLVFKKKRRKGYQKLNGHRQDLSQIEIEDITLNGKGSAKKETAKKPETKEPVKKEAPKKAAVKDAPKKAEAKKVVKKETTPKTETKTAKPDKLTKIEGIGPKIAGILADAGMDTFKKLSTAKAEKISEILVAAGGNAYNRFDPTTWPKQAKLAADGKWDELQKLQDELNGGKA